MNFVSRQIFRLPKSTFCRYVAAKYSTKTGSKEHIEELVKDKPVSVFMKGTPSQPRCGFSNAVVQILHFHGVTDFTSYNVLEDDDIRQGQILFLKTTPTSISPIH